MNPLPIHRFEITSPLKRQDAVAALGAHLVQTNFFRLRIPNSANDKRFQGVVTDTGFSISRVLGYNNVFAPQSAGTIQGAGIGSQIGVTMKPHLLVVAFYLAVLAFGAIGIIVGGGDFGMVALVALILYVLVMFGFWFEANKQERTLREIFRAL
ncbi:MAG: hypothetical protein JNL81_11320 [Hyphomonadaceae bacterium]|nr:hypothetical protein [Hyphomonadaceae bacterium]